VLETDTGSNSSPVLAALLLGATKLPQPTIGWAQLWLCFVLSGTRANAKRNLSRELQYCRIAGYQKRTLQSSHCKISLFGRAFTPTFLWPEEAAQG